MSRDTHTPRFWLETRNSAFDIRKRNGVCRENFRVTRRFDGSVGFRGKSKIQRLVNDGKSSRTRPPPLYKQWTRWFSAIVVPSGPFKETHLPLPPLNRLPGRPSAAAFCRQENVSCTETGIDRDHCYRTLPCRCAKNNLSARCVWKIKLPPISARIGNNLLQNRCTAVFRRCFRQYTAHQTHHALNRLHIVNRFSWQKKKKSAF